MSFHRPSHLRCDEESATIAISPGSHHSDDDLLGAAVFVSPALAQVRHATRMARFMSGTALVLSLASVSAIAILAPGISASSAAAASATSMANLAKSAAAGGSGVIGLSSVSAGDGIDEVALLKQLQQQQQQSGAGIANGYPEELQKMLMPMSKEEREAELREARGNLKASLQKLQLVKRKLLGSLEKVGNGKIVKDIEVTSEKVAKNAPALGRNALHKAGDAVGHLVHVDKAKNVLDTVGHAARQTGKRTVEAMHGQP